MVALTFKEFSEANGARCVESFGRKISDTENAIPFALGVAEEAGEVIGAVRGHVGITKRKSATTAEEIGDEIGDLIAYADCLAQSLGLDLETVVARKFNHVSERVGSSVRVTEYGWVR